MQQAAGGAFVQGFLDSEEREMDLAGGRAAIAWLKRVTSNLEYGKVPAAQVELVVGCLLGMSFIKYSELRCAYRLQRCKDTSSCCAVFCASSQTRTSIGGIPKKSH